MHVAMKQALLLMMASLWLYVIAITLARVRSIILERERNTQWVNELDEVRE
jgi:heme exporter protein C